jgi:molybdopterin biosynthesis enzyme MoaB
MNKRALYFNTLIPIVIITVSNTLREESGIIAEDLLKIRSNLSIVERVTIPNTEFDKTLQNYLTRDDIRCIITIGGTGISPTDNVIEIGKNTLKKNYPVLVNYFDT